MPEVKLKIANLVLDHDNPRITHADGQVEALQKIVKDQKTKLVKLAQSIVDHGLNPMDRLLVLRVDGRQPSFIALEGNRRVAVMKLLTNPAVMSGLDMPPPMKKIFERLADRFAKEKVRAKIEPIAAFELATRQEGDYWLELRHKGQNQGAGIVDWTSVASQRFRTRSPAIQALEMVVERGGLSSADRAKITEKFPLSTLQRFLEDREVRKAIGVDVKKGKLVTKAPSEAIKPLKRIVLDLATKTKRVGGLMRTSQMLDYVGSFGKDSVADLSKSKGEERPVDDIPVSEFGRKPAPPRRKPDPSDRKEVVPRGCRINVTDNRIAEIYKELRTIKLDDAPNSISVLLRVFLEMSVDHYLEDAGISLKATDGGRERWKKLDRKLTEVIDHLVSNGVPASQLAAVKRSVSVQTSPMNVELFHLYVHERFATPSPTELKAAWNNAQKLFEFIWP